MFKSNQKGFSQIFIVLLIVLILGFFAYRKYNTKFQGASYLSNNEDNATSFKEGEAIGFSFSYPTG